jgi:hypothetical protein
VLHNIVYWIMEDLGRFSPDGQSWSHQLHESLFMWNVVEGTHVLAIMFFAGTIWLIDLRLMGIAFPNVRLSTLFRHVLPINKGSFGVMIITGIIAFIGRDPLLYYHNIWFRLKMVFLVIALMNILFFDNKTKKGMAEWDAMSPVAPVSERTKVPFYAFLGTSILLLLSLFIPGLDMTVAVLLRLALGVAALASLFLWIDRRAVTPPVRVKLAGAVSLFSWLLVIMFGRFIAYDWFNCDRIEPGSVAYVLQSCDVYLESVKKRADYQPGEKTTTGPVAERVPAGDAALAPTLGR